ncbi:glutamate receptor ionotropic, kainate glr-3-like isoform X2 [Eriocheir sinensis]|uniref:glutamate receptor ionotropic, kainate glr-3-like isoform X2 n=1 Tax=Eriocheir sinensis TaxID=95602 RepID=UPI0021CA31A0|nr:glutamate receptor ionotropic, kainate glr-3-like isoform X2 [Eriocheir sinensis]
MDAPSNASCLTVAYEQFYGPLIIHGTAPNITYSGPMVELFDIMAKHLGYCYRREVSHDREFGRPLPNGSWTGIIGMLQRQDANVTGTLMSVTWIRSKVVDFSTAIDMDEFTAFSALPALTSDMSGFVKSFSYQTWVLLLLSSLITFVAIFLVLQRQERLNQSPKRRRWGDLGASAEWQDYLQQSSLWTWCSLVAQSVPWEAEGDAVRMMVGMWLLTGYVVAIVYRCVLKAMLILPSVRLPFDSLEELVQSGLPVAVGDATSIHVEIMVGRCRAYIMSRGFFGPNSLSLAFPKGSPLKAQFDPIIVRFREFGIIQKVFGDALSKAADCFKPFQATHALSARRPLHLDDFYGVFSLFAAGILLASLAFLVEVIRGSRRRLKD